ncbi:MAG: hypothetical protein JXQ71_04520 [Verrucomicrobia bacterium]|nr:hypothetical protein [Verrucomicrobiota bacterium]
MNLTDDQKQTVAGWLAEGLKLSEIQSRLESAFGLRLTYLEVRMLMADLSLMPKDIPPPQPPHAASHSPLAPPDRPPAPLGPAPDGRKPQAGPAAEDWADEADEAAPAGGLSGNVVVSMDQLARPGALVSGKVTFSDGQSAQWYLDQMGRLGLIPAQQGYRPSPADLQEFQMALDVELRRMGM